MTGEDILRADLAVIERDLDRALAAVTALIGVVRSVLGEHLALTGPAGYDWRRAATALSQISGRSETPALTTARNGTGPGATTPDPVSDPTEGEEVGWPAQH